jgi:hypothetical protein
MIQARQTAGGQRLEITDTPSPIARLFSGLFRVGTWLGVVMAVAGIVGTIVAIVRSSGDPWAALEIAANGVLFSLLGWGGHRGWSRLVLARRTVVDRARGTIQIVEKANSREESCADVAAVRITVAETTGPQGVSLRMHRLWLVLAHDRTVLLGDVGDARHAVARLERAGTTIANFFGVPIERGTSHDVAPASEHVVQSSAGRVPIDRTLQLMSWKQRLMFVPGIAIILGGSMYFALELFHPTPDEPQRVLMPIMIPLMLLVPLVPMLALGGSIRVRTTHDALEVVRWPSGARVRVPLPGGPVRFEVHALGGRTRGLSRLSCTTTAGSYVLIQQGQHARVQQIADELARAL